MDYNDDTPEGIYANEALTKHLYDPEESLQGIEGFIAVDYFKYGWEAAMKFAEEMKP